MSRPRVQSLIKLTYWTFSVGSKQRTLGRSMEGGTYFPKTTQRAHARTYYCTVEPPPSFLGA